MFTSARILVVRSALVVAALSCALPVGTALAESHAESTAVQFGDLDLATDAGITALYGRIKSAAWQVCFREMSSQGGIDQQARLYQCYENAVANAVEHVGKARIVTLHRAESPFAAN
jgi:UrcA family protein